MTESQTGTLLRRRIAPARPVRRADESQLEHTLTIEMPRSADKLLALDVAVQAVSQAVGSSGTVVEALNDNDLVCLMTSEGKPPGIIVADTGLISAAIEIQTLGKVTPAPPNERPATRVDVVILSDLIDKWLTDIRLAAETNGCVEAIPFYDYARAPRVLSVRAVELMLEPIAYRSIRISLALGGGAKTGLLTLVVPVSGQTVRAAVSGTIGQQLEPHVLEAPLQLDAVLNRIEMSLSEVLALSAGQIIDVPKDLLGRIRIESDGRLVDHAHLGQAQGKRAVRLGSTAHLMPLLEGVAKGPKPMDVVADESELNLDEPPQIPDLPELPELPEDLPELPVPLPDADDEMLADLPDLPDLSDLPPLPDE